MGSKAERKKAPSVLKREELEKKGALMEKKRNKGVSLMGKKRIVIFLFEIFVEVDKALFSVSS